MKRSFNFGLIGVGGIGAYHRRSIQRLASSGQAQLVSIADPTFAPDHPERTYLEKTGVQWFENYTDMLEQQVDLQAVTIATPIPYHFEMALACARKGLPVMLEKPPTPLLSQLETLIASDSQEKIRVGFQMISSQCLQQLRKLILEGHLGDLQSIRVGACWPRLDSYYTRARWAGRLSLDGQAVLDGPATNALAHLIHSILFLAGDEEGHYGEPTSLQAELYRARPIESYDTVCLRGELESGVEFSLAATHATMETLPFQIEVKGSRSWARLSEDGALLETGCGSYCHHPEETQNLINRCYEHFVRYQEGHPIGFPSSLREARGYVKVTNAMFQSAPGITTLDPGLVWRYGSDNNRGYHVPGLHAAIQEHIHSGKLFSEQALPWASFQGETIDFIHFDGIHLEDLQSTTSSIELTVT